jgi:hypothetical protein
VLESGSDLIDAFAIELAVVFETAGDVPALAADILDQLLGSVPTVELHKDDPTGGQQRAQRFQNTFGQAVLAAKGNALPGLALTVEASHGFGSQVQAQIDGDDQHDPIVADSRPFDEQMTILGNFDRGLHQRGFP